LNRLGYIHIANGCHKMTQWWYTCSVTDNWIELNQNTEFPQPIRSAKPADGPQRHAIAPLACIHWMWTLVSISVEWHDRHVRMYVFVIILFSNNIGPSLVAWGGDATYEGLVERYMHEFQCVGWVSVPWCDNIACVPPSVCDVRLCESHWSHYTIITRYYCIMWGYLKCEADNNAKIAEMYLKYDCYFSKLDVRGFGSVKNQFIRYINTLAGASRAKWVNLSVTKLVSFHCLYLRWTVVSSSNQCSMEPIPVI